MGKNLSVAAALLILLAGVPILKAGDAAPGAVKTQSFQAKSPKRPDTHRGVTFPVKASQLLYLKRGDRVDVLMTFVKTSAGRKEKVTVTVLQNVPVVNIKKPEKKGAMGAVEVMCDPEEAQKAALGDAMGEIHLAIRAPEDGETRSLEEANFRKLFK